MSEAGTAVVAAPNLEQFEKEAPLIVEEAKAITVTNEKGYEAAGQWMRRAKTYEAGVRAEFKPTEDAQRLAAKNLKAFKDRGLAAVLQSIALVDPRMASYQKKRREAEDARRKKAADAALEKARLEREAEEKRLAKQAKKDPEAQTKLEELQEKPVVADAVSEKRPIKKQDGFAGRQTWDFDIVDKQALLQACAAGTAPLHYIKIDRAAIGKVVRAEKGRVVIPGIKPFIKDGTQYNKV